MTAARAGASSDGLASALARSLRNSSGRVDDPVAAVVELRPSGVPLSGGSALAAGHYFERPRLIGELRASGMDGPEANALADRLLLNAVGELDEAGQVSYRAAADVIVSDGEFVRVVRAGDAAVADSSVGRAFAQCRVPVTGTALNSFAGGTLVALADGTLAPIADIQVGDLVLAYDFETGETVAREVTATLPHEDWLLQAHLSDGSVMSVTEDHRFWSVTDNGWVELQHLDTTDQLLTPDGATVTVDYLDWDAGETAPAFDLTVDQEHNFFVTAEHDGQPVLVHNETLRRFACGAKVSAGTFTRIAAAEDALDAATRVRLASVADALSRRTVPDTIGGSRSRLDVFVEQLESVTSDAELRRVLAGASFGENVVDAALGTGRVVDILGHTRFVEAASSATPDVLATRIATKRALEDDTINAVRTADAVFDDLPITNATIRDHWRVYSGALDQDDWLAAYVRIKVNQGSGSVFERGAVAAAGVPADAVSKPVFDFKGVVSPGPVADRGGFSPDNAAWVRTDNGQLDYPSWIEAKNLNTRPLDAGVNSNAANLGVCRPAH